MKKIVLIGPGGQLGSELKPVLQGLGSVLSLDHADFEVSNAARVGEVIGKSRPDVVINTAAFHKVEECELHPTRAFEVNAVGAMNLAKVCRAFGAVLVHFSTDYVFDGGKGQSYLEGDQPDPLNVYGTSKVAGEHLIAVNLDRYFVIRTSGLYGRAGSSGKGGNFVETMLKKAREGGPIRVVDDQVLTPTCVRDLAATVGQLISTEAYGLYHITCEGQCSWYEFARKIFELQGLQADLQPIKTREIPSPVSRPPFSVLSKAKLKALGLCMPRWDVALGGYLKSRTRKPELASVLDG